MVVEDRFGNNSKFKKKNQKKNRLVALKIMITTVCDFVPWWEERKKELQRNKFAVTERKKERWSLCGQRIVSRR